MRYSWCDFNDDDEMLIKVSNYHVRIPQLTLLGQQHSALLQRVDDCEFAEDVNLFMCVSNNAFFMFHENLKHIYAQFFNINLLFIHNFTRKSLIFTIAHSKSLKSWILKFKSLTGLVEDKISFVWRHTACTCNYPSVLSRGTPVHINYGRNIDDAVSHQVLTFMT